MTPPQPTMSLAARISSLETFRDDVARPGIVDHARRLRVLELGWAKLVGASVAGSVLGGGLVSLVATLTTKGTL